MADEYKQKARELLERWKTAADRAVTALASERGMIPGMVRKAAESQSRRLATALEGLQNANAADEVVRILKSVAWSEPVHDQERQDLVREIERDEHGDRCDDVGIVAARVLGARRVCPQPRKWEQLWQRLQPSERTSIGRRPGPPLILAAWWHSTPWEKRRRLIEHLRYAHEMGRLEEAVAFLEGLSDAEWVKLEDAASGRAGFDHLDEGAH